MISRTLLTAAAALAAITPAACSAGHDAEKAALKVANEAESAADRIKADVAYLADDRRAGRETGTEGYFDAAKYVAARFDSLGLDPGVDRDWFQTVKFRSAKRDMDAARMDVISADGKSETLVHLEDYLIARSLGDSEFDVTAPAVFVGYGVVDEDSGYDDYAGLDAAGKIVVAFSGAPASFDSERRAHIGSSEQKLLKAAARGAVGFVFIRTKASEARTPWRRIVANPTSAAMTWIRPDGGPHLDAPEPSAAAQMSGGGAAKLFAGSAKSYAEAQADEARGAVKGFDLARSVRLKGASLFEEEESPNVVGLIEGSDPNLKDEAVVLTAHLDHIGTRPPNSGADVINNGAVDNALGVATFLDVARAFKAGAPPRRTIVIVALTGEEKGLLGADYFARYPATGGARMVANVNLDMPMTLFPFTDVIAFGAERSTLGPLVEAAAGKMNVSLSPDPIPEEGIFTRSDHYRFVEQGVPSVYIMLGYQNGGEAVFEDFLKNHYHQPSDQVTLPINYEEAARFAELNYLIARAIADADAAPEWNAGDFFGDLFAKQP